MRKLRPALAGAVLLGAALLAAPARAADATPPLPSINWSFAGLFGTFDRASAQRGFQIYNQVCSACHSLKQAYYRDLAGIGFSEADIKTIAASHQVPTLDENGQPAERPALPSDHFRAPYPNDLAGRAANGGALPPDLSVITKAREGGPDYVYGILTGYRNPPVGFNLTPGKYYSMFFPGHQISMPQMLHDDTVTYIDGTKATADQEARDVVTFLSYIANPELEVRHRLGVQVVLFLLLLTGLTYTVKRKLWAGVHH
jgi:ubiquinol-cytochrome c reductase cytochrome c1 subunit